MQTLSTSRKKKNPRFRRTWCCSFGIAPQSPDIRSSSHTSKQPRNQSQKPYAASFHSFPSPSRKLGRGIIDPRRIYSPGRVSPIDPDGHLAFLPEIADVVSVAAAAVESEPESLDPALREEPVAPEKVERVLLKESSLDLRLGLKGRDGRCLVLELDSRELCESSSFFAAMVSKSRRKGSDALADCPKIEVGDVEDVGVFKQTVELIYEKDPMRWLMNVGVSRSIDILEVSSTIMFERGVMSCLKYLEAVPWSESEEEKLKSLFTSCTFDEAVSQDVLARLHPQGPAESEDLAIKLIEFISNGTNCNARKELQSLVNGLLSKSSVYQKEPAGLNKESLYYVCHSCLNSLMELFEEASDSVPTDQTAAMKGTRPLIERISKQVGNLNWLLEILIDKQMAEDFVDLWANQKELIKMHERASPMVRYELSRISASVFIALGKGKLQCRGNTRFSVLQAWFGPMLVDFGWLQRCSKGLDMRMLEDGLGQAVLTLPLNQQQSLFVEWFRCFAKKGTECPNLSKAFQVWWRRSFPRSSETLG